MNNPNPDFPRRLQDDPEWIKATSAPTRPEAIQEAMLRADGMRALYDESQQIPTFDEACFMDLAAYVRELEAKLEERSEAADGYARRLSETVKICDKETDRAEKLKAELAEARKGRG